MNHYTLFNEKSADYARIRPRYPDELYRYLAGLCRDHRVVWDCACGNGQVAVDLVDYFKRVYATDVSQQQIANALKKPRISYDVVPAEATPFDDDLFDLVSVAQALHWFEYDRFWPEVKRVLKPGGIFAAWGYSFFTINSPIDAALRDTLLASIDPFWDERNRLLWNHYRDVPFPFEKLTPPTIPLVLDWTLDELFAYLLTWSAVRRCIEQAGDGFVSDAYTRLGRLWGDPQNRRKVTMDFCLLVGKY
ncbi:MAG: class I SAM-dependent methyltransferase [Anaerolineae bacterium]|nr:class I SAM-dependent methyltransferase [Anaerolineae bacterium]